jgi:hypothetical protein
VTAAEVNYEKEIKINNERDKGMKNEKAEKTRCAYEVKRKFLKELIAWFPFTTYTRSI